MDDDPFERLPEHILHHILSMLPSRKAVARTTLISRSWQRAWYSYPLSDFNLQDFCPAGYPTAIGTLREANEKFLGFIDSTMSRLREHGTSLPKLKIWTTLVEIDHSPSLLDRWICMALDDGAQELDLGVLDKSGVWSYGIPVISGFDSGPFYRVPARVFSSGFHIKTLALHGSRLSADPLDDSISTVNLNSLHTLKLIDVRINDQMLQKLLHGCPLLESLTLGQCRSLRKVIISGLHKLRKIHLDGKFYRVEIEAPSLEKFIYSADEGAGEDVIFGLDGCRELKELSLWCCAISQEKLQGLLPKFPLLESLRIAFCFRVRKIGILNPLITTIGVIDRGSSLDIEVDAPKLSCFEFNSDGIPFIRMRSLTPLCSYEVSFTPTNLADVGEWFVRLGEFVSRSCWLKSLTVNIGFMKLEPHVAPGDILLPSLPGGIDELRLVGTGIAPPSGYGLILDGMLSACHPKTLYVDRCGRFLKFVCQKFATGKHDTDCRCSPQKKCWSHELKRLISLSGSQFLCEKLATREDYTNCGRCSPQKKCWSHELKRWEIERIGQTNYVGSLDWTSLLSAGLLPLDNLAGVYFRLHW